MYDGTSLLPTRTNVNPANPVNEYLDDRGSVVVVKNAHGKYSAILNHAAPDENIGDKFLAHHDQAGYSFGTLTVVGLVWPVAPDGKRPTVGDVPNRKVSARVYK